MSKLPVVGVPMGVGVPVKILRHDKRNWRVVSVPKSAVPEPVLRAVEVSMVLGAPQLGATFAIEARRWVEKVHHVYYITRKPYVDFLNHLAAQGVTTLLLYQIAPSYR